MKQVAAETSTFRRDWVAVSSNALEANLHGRSGIDLDAVDEPDAMRMGLHEHRADADAFAEKAYALHQRTVGDAGRCENDVASGGKVFGLEDALHVRDPHRLAPFFVARLGDDEPA